MSSTKKDPDQDVIAPQEESRFFDIGNGESVPEIIFTYERTEDGKIHRKKKRLVKRPRNKVLSDV